MIELREITLELSEVRLSALESGPPDGPKVLALHGWMDNAASFLPLAERLRDLHIVSVDFSGHGLSQHRSRGLTPTFLDWIPEVLELLDALEWERCRFLTHSMGAAVGILVAAVAPEKVERLVLLDGFGPISEPADKAPQRLARALSVERKILETPVGPCRSVDEAVAARRRNGPDLSEEAARLLVARGTKICDDGGFRFRHDPRLRLPSRMYMTEDQVLAFLREVRCPVLAIRPKGGWPAPEHMIESRFAAFPDATLLEVEGGHHVHLTHPERVAGAIGEFLEA